MVIVTWTSRSSDSSRAASRTKPVDRCVFGVADRDAGQAHQPPGLLAAFAGPVHPIDAVVDIGPGEPLEQLHRLVEGLDGDAPQLVGHAVLGVDAVPHGGWRSSVRALLAPPDRVYRSPRWPIGPKLLERASQSSPQARSILAAGAVELARVQQPMRVGGDRCCDHRRGTPVTAETPGVRVHDAHTEIAETAHALVESLLIGEGRQQQSAEAAHATRSMGIEMDPAVGKRVDDLVVAIDDCVAGDLQVTDRRVGPLGRAA